MNDYRVESEQVGGVLKSGGRSSTLSAGNTSKKYRYSEIHVDVSDQFAKGKE